MLLVVTMVALPLLAGRGERHSLKRPWSIAVTLGIVFIIWHYPRIGEVAPSSSRAGERGRRSQRPRSPAIRH